jgi:hypothetical protein
MADTLMSQTLPTIIGMGVVAHTTNTMFGRGRRKAASKSRAKARPSNRSKGPVIHRGPRGGRYIIRRGRRVYL